MVRIGWSGSGATGPSSVSDRSPSAGCRTLVGFGVGWEGLPGDTLQRLARYRGPLLAVCPENDEFGSPKDVRKALDELDVEHVIEVVAGADHFLQGRDREVGETVAEFLAANLARA